MTAIMKQLRDKAYAINNMPVDKAAAIARALEAVPQVPTKVTTKVTTTPATPTAPAPFYPFTPDFPTWKGDLAYTSSDYLLLNVNPTKEKSVTEDPLKDRAKPAVFLTPRVLKEVQYIVDRMAPITGECAWMFLAKPLSDSDERIVLIYDYFLAEQDATGAHVSLDMGDVSRYTTYLKDTFPDEWQGKAIAESLHHGHSHANMQVFNSNTDKNQQESSTELGFQSRHRFFLIFNAKKEVRCTMVMYAPIFHRIEDVPVGIYTGDGVAPCVSIPKDRKKQLNEMMDTLIKKPAPRVSGWNRHWRNTLLSTPVARQTYLNGYKNNRPAWDKGHLKDDYFADYYVDTEDLEGTEEEEVFVEVVDAASEMIWGMFENIIAKADKADTDLVDTLFEKLEAAIERENKAPLQELGNLLFCTPGSPESTTNLIRNIMLSYTTVYDFSNCDVQDTFEMLFVTTGEVIRAIMRVIDDISKLYETPMFEGIMTYARDYEINLGEILYHSGEAPQHGYGVLWDELTATTTTIH